jgi:hypothetical protein
VTQVTPAKKALLPRVVVVTVHVVPFRTSIVPASPIATQLVVDRHVMLVNGSVVLDVIVDQLVRFVVVTMVPA